MSTKQKKQHYVWQHYLRPWTTKGLIYCYRHSEKKLFKTGTSSIANETYFYQTQRLTSNELKYIEILINKAKDDELRELHRGTVEMFQLTFALRDKLASFPLSAEKRAALEKELHEADQTLGEGFHTTIENKTAHILQALRTSDCGFYSNLEQCIDFVHYLAHQAFRTPKLRHLAATLQASNPYPDLDLKKVWLIESHIFATNVSRGIFAERHDYKFTFIENPTPIPFITGDQPVINFNTHEDAELRLYYPLSPKLAVIFEKNPSLPFKTVRQASRIEVEHYNQEIFSKCTDQIYGNDESYLKALSQNPKDVLAAS